MADIDDFLSPPRGVIRCENCRTLNWADEDYCEQCAEPLYD